MVRLHLSDHRHPNVSTLYNPLPKQLVSVLEDAPRRGVLSPLLAHRTVMYQKPTPERTGRRGGQGAGAAWPPRGAGGARPWWGRARAPRPRPSWQPRRRVAWASRRAAATAAPALLR